LASGQLISSMNPNEGDRSITDVTYLVDTGTNFLLAPRKHFTKFVRSLFPREMEAFNEKCGTDASRDNLVVCDCSIVDGSTAKPFEVVLGGKSFSLTSRQLFKEVAARNGKKTLPPHDPAARHVLRGPLAVAEGTLGRVLRWPRGLAGRHAARVVIGPWGSNASFCNAWGSCWCGCRRD